MHKAYLVSFPPVDGISRGSGRLVREVSCIHDEYVPRSDSRSSLVEGTSVRDIGDVVGYCGGRETSSQIGLDRLE